MITYILSWRPNSRPPHSFRPTSMMLMPLAASNTPISRTAGRSSTGTWSPSSGRSTTPVRAESPVTPTTPVRGKDLGNTTKDILPPTRVSSDVVRSPAAGVPLLLGCWCPFAVSRRATSPLRHTSALLPSHNKVESPAFPRTPPPLHSGQLSTLALAFPRLTQPHLALQVQTSSTSRCRRAGPPDRPTSLATHAASEVRYTGPLATGSVSTLSPTATPTEAPTPPTRSELPASGSTSC